MRLRPYPIEFHDKLGRFMTHTFYAASKSEAMEYARAWALRKFPGRQFTMQ